MYNPGALSRFTLTPVVNSGAVSNFDPGPPPPNVPPPPAPIMNQIPMPIRPIPDPPSNGDEGIPPFVTEPGAPIEPPQP